MHLAEEKVVFETESHVGNSEGLGIVFSASEWDTCAVWKRCKSADMNKGRLEYKEEHEGPNRRIIKNEKYLSFFFFLVKISIAFTHRQ